MKKSRRRCLTLLPGEKDPVSRSAEDGLKSQTLTNPSEAVTQKKSTLPSKIDLNTPLLKRAERALEQQKEQQLQKDPTESVDDKVTCELQKDIKVPIENRVELTLK